jgi:hypothetical protein
LRIVPTNSDTSGATQPLLTEAKHAIAAGDRARALRLLDSLRYRPSEEGRQLPRAIADALLATARGDRDDERALIAPRLEDAHAALRQILEWIDAVAFDADQLAQIAAAASRRQGGAVRIEGAPDESVATNRTDLRPVPFGSGWLEWRWVAKPSGRQFGPYVYFRWREGGRKRTKYVGKVGR